MSIIHPQLSTMQFLLLIIGVLVLNLLPGTADAKMYTWVDASGKTHFSDTPPKGAKQSSQEYKPKQRLHYNKEASPEQKQQRDKFLRNRQKQTDRKKSAQIQARQIRKRYAKYCKQQRKRYKAFADKKYRRYIDDDGNYQVYTDESRAKQLQKIKRNIQKHCK